MSYIYYCKSVRILGLLWELALLRGCGKEGFMFESKEKHPKSEKGLMLKNSNEDFK